MKTAYEADKCCNKDSEKGHHAAMKPLKWGTIKEPNVVISAETE